jgi:hypothetical protein
VPSSVGRVVAGDTGTGGDQLQESHNVFQKRWKFMCVPRAETIRPTRVDRERVQYYVRI